MFSATVGHLTQFQSHAKNKNISLDPQCFISLTNITDYKYHMSQLQIIAMKLVIKIFGNAF